jgi:hypothetical protein
MNALKKILIQQILETQDESLLNMLWEIVKLNQDQMENKQMLEPSFSDYSNMHASEIQQSIDSFFNPQSSKNDNF